MSATGERRRVIELTQTDLDAAYVHAKRIDDPWFRCQSLAWVARYTDGKTVQRIAKEAVKAAFATENENRCVAVSAWPVRAMIERRRYDQAAETVAALLPVAARIENPVSRGDGLFLLWQAVYSVESLRNDVLVPLLAACYEMNSWKAPRLLGWIAEILASDDPEASRAVLALMNEGRRKRHAERSIAANTDEKPRDFFW